MKDKPLSFQIWVVSSLLSALFLVIGFVIFMEVLDYQGIAYWQELKMKNISVAIKLVICLIIANSIVAKFISEIIVEPIKIVEESMRSISMKKCDKEIVSVSRQDEIGSMMNSLVRMQNNLNKQKEEEEFFLQSVSHGLKTPIMVIKNCCQALRDGIYINDSEDETIKVIEGEASTLEDTVKKFLVINSFDYLLGKKTDFKELPIKTLLLDVANKLSAGNNIQIEVTGETLNIFGNEELVRDAVNNLVENALRYAKHYIRIEVYKDAWEPSKNVLVSVANDGEAINEETLGRFFEKYHKGRNGNFGLGLYITKRIMEFHEGIVWAENGQEEVKFIMKFPCKNFISQNKI